MEFSLWQCLGSSSNWGHIHSKSNVHTFFFFLQPVLSNKFYVVTCKVNQKFQETVLCLAMCVVL